jgi:hypothetical protein
MSDSRSPAALHGALRCVVTSDLPSDHKATLIAVVTQALRDEEAAEMNRQAGAPKRGLWQEDEIVQLKGFLQGKVAGSWQHADESVMHMAAQLHRDPRSVRDKAAELGLGVSVDYRLARALTRTRDE